MSLDGGRCRPDLVLDIGGAQLRLYRFAYTKEASAWMQKADLHMDWEQRAVRCHGKTWPTPRLTAYVAAKAANYRYSGLVHPGEGIPEALEPWFDRVQDDFETPLNSVLANRYRDGRDGIGPHTDSEDMVVPGSKLVTVSLGATRTFVIHHPAGGSTSIPLAHGDALVMNERARSEWRHAIPKTAKPVGERISLTFRRIELERIPF